MISTPKRQYIDSRGKRCIIHGTCRNLVLEDASAELFLIYDEYIQAAIDDMYGWEARPGKAYQKKEIGTIEVEGADTRDLALQLAKCYTDPNIDIPGVPSHNHPEYSELFAYPRGEGMLILGREGDSLAREIPIFKGIFTFIDGNEYHAVRPLDSEVYVALMRFDPELIEIFGKGNHLRMRNHK